MRRFLATLALFCLPASAEAFPAFIQGLAGGDMLIARSGNDQFAISLYGVDCPEIDQNFGLEAQEFTSDLVLGKWTEIQVVGKDEYGRPEGLVFVGDDAESLNEKLLKAGLAWLTIEECKDQNCTHWRNEMATARARRTGLWTKAEPMPPWEWRWKTFTPPVNGTEP